MRHRSFLVAASVAMSLMGVSLIAGHSLAQVVQGKSRPITTGQLMQGLVLPNSTELGKSLQGTGPADDNAWKMTTVRAALLCEAGFVLMDDGRCPDATWAGACKTLQDQGKTLIESCKAKDLPTAKTSFQALTAGCKSCHTAHRKKPAQ